MEVDILVECAITGNQAEYEYDIDNTFLGFMKDINNDSPSLGFTPASIKDGTQSGDSGIIIDGRGFRFLEYSGDTLASLGVKNGSLIVITEPHPSCLGPDQERAGASALKKKPRTLLKKKVRPKLKKKPPRILIKIDPQSMSNLEILRAAALNEIRMDAKFISVDALRTHLEQLIIGKKKFRLSLPKKFRKKSFATPLGDIKYSNMLLWCDACKDIDLSSMHLHHACIELFGTSVADEKLAGDKVFSLVDTRCTTSGCTGTFRMWNLRDNPPKYV
jgi:hypothetical protein